MLQSSDATRPITTMSATATADCELSHTVRTKEANMKSEVIKRSVVLARDETSISLEDEFWQGLKEIARARNMALSPLVLAIRKCHQGNLSSAVRVLVYSTMVAGTWLQLPHIAPDHS
jgi:predicted DNA-binding ribbon-helix-helix protein